MEGQNSLALKNLAEDSQNKIEFCGEYQNQNISTDVFEYTDCIVVPSIWAENSPLVIHEAQAAKIPVITANFGGMSEYVKHKVNGLLFEHRNFEKLYEQMESAIENKQEFSELGKKGYLYSKNGEVQSIGEHCKKLEEIYKPLIYRK